jgi:hypothetical protein
MNMANGHEATVLHNAPLLMIVASCALTGVSFCDVVRLKQGGKIEGEIVEETATKVVLKAGGGVVTVDTAEIAAIDRSARSETTSSAAEAPAAKSVSTGARFRVTCHFADPSIASECLAAAEAAWSATLATLGEKTIPVERPLEINVYDQPAECSAAQTRAGARIQEDVGGFCDHASRSAHVLLSPLLDIEIYKKIGAPNHILSTVAHEACHLTVGTCLPNGPHPSWLAEGIAQHVESEVHRVRRASAGLEADPYWATSMVACQRLLRSKSFPGVRAIIQGRLGNLSAFDTYAVHWAFFEVLFQPAQRARFDELLETLRRMPPGPDLANRLERKATAIWGDEGIADLEDALSSYVDGLAPEWSITGALDVTGDRWMQWSPSAGDAACAWRVARIGRANYVVSGTIEFLSGSDPAAGISFGLDGGGFVSVSLSARGGVQVSERNCSGDEHRELVGTTLVKPLAARKTAFEVHVDCTTIRVRLDGLDVIPAMATGRELTGPWGLEANAGTVALWSGMRVR